jgi:holo-[acyl-carrier protein] synthase
MNHIGVDLIETRRLEKAIAKWGERFLSRVFTRAELELCRGKVASLAARMAAKEAAMKALGTGLCEMRWWDVEVLSDAAGRPVVNLSGGARARAALLGINSMVVSLSHTREHAIAYVHSS